ncbi:hypothetical protein DPMN_034267 [Dreissena polymorpha]|uniref:Uncharacterized protein n=1 Tax=Dreissena polymorpha TaxID=45954 RepID=A0A9D4M6I1_DREPO|nr:hypothetical protein DPMN_034267 [Dreissena polymorpha]
MLKLAQTDRPTDQQTDQQTGQKQYVPHYYSIMEGMDLVMDGHQTTHPKANSPQDYSPQKIVNYPQIDWTSRRISPRCIFDPGGASGLVMGPCIVEIYRIVIRDVQYQLEVNRCRNEEFQGSSAYSVGGESGQDGQRR